MHKKRIEAVFGGQWPDRVPICEQAFASSVASEILGREAYTGSTDVHYQETLAWVRGPAAHEEFVDRLYEDTIALHRALDLDILFLPWRMSARPTKQIDERRFLYGNPEGDGWWVGQYDPGSRTFGRVESGHCGQGVMI